MTLGEIIKDYREKNDMSMDAFSERSGISKAYISLLEKNKHPQTGKEIAPSIKCIKQAADGMNMDFNTLFGMIDGDVSLDEKDENDAYYANPDTAEIAQEIFDNHDLRVLFDAARDATPEDLKTTYDMLMALKRKEDSDND